MAFEVFQKGSAPTSTVPTVTIQKRGLFSLNQAAYELLGKPEAVQFLWDSEEKLIALQQADPNDLNSYPARRQNAAADRGPVLVAGTMFSRFIGLDTSQARRWVPEKRQDMLIVDTKQEGSLVLSNRERGARRREQGGGASETP